VSNIIEGGLPSEIGWLSNLKHIEIGKWNSSFLLPFLRANKTHWQALVNFRRFTLHQRLESIVTDNPFRNRKVGQASVFGFRYDDSKCVVFKETSKFFLTLSLHTKADNKLEGNLPSTIGSLSTLRTFNVCKCYWVLFS
jgi:hypothetical protein